MPNDLASDARAIKALGHPVRLGIALRLAHEPETCACDFADVFGVSQPTVSEHLRVLREAGLVTTVRRGTQICYSLDPGAIADLRRLLDGLQPSLQATA
jgi:ArsR family transcriptional regulator